LNDSCKRSCSNYFDWLKSDYLFVSYHSFDMKLAKTLAFFLQLFKNFILIEKIIKLIFYHIFIKLKIYIIRQNDEGAFTIINSTWHSCTGTRVPGTARRCGLFYGCHDCYVNIRLKLFYENCYIFKFQKATTFWIFFIALRA